MRAALLCLLVLGGCASFDAAASKPVKDVLGAVAQVKPFLAYCPLLPVEARQACADAAEGVKRAEGVASALLPEDADAGKE